MHPLVVSRKITFIDTTAMFEFLVRFPVRLSKDKISRHANYTFLMSWEVPLLLLLRLLFSYDTKQQRSRLSINSRSLPSLRI